jgi:hypothetical protein
VNLPTNICYPHGPSAAMKPRSLIERYAGFVYGLWLHAGVSETIGRRSLVLNTQ